MVDEFYLDVNLELFVQWLFGNKNKYDHNILCTLKSNEPYGKTITFNYYNISGSIVIWANGIIEEQIFDDEENLLFYLHYKLVSLAQGQKLFYDFYDSLTKHTKCPPLKIILCCSGGLSSSFFANKLAELISLKHLNYEIIPLGFYQLNSSYLDCDAIYLAPQISYLEPQAMNIVKNTVSVHCVTPSVYATYNYRGLLDMITNENISKTKENGTI